MRILGVLSEENKRYLIKKVIEKVEKDVGRRYKEILEENKQLKEENERLKELVKDKQSSYELDSNTQEMLK